MKHRMNFINRFKFAWRYASSGKFVATGFRTYSKTRMMLFELYQAQIRGESAMFMFTNGAIYTEKAMQNKLKTELAKHNINIES